MYKGLFMDFGGVIADEGYRDGLHKIADKYNIASDIFFKKCADLIYESGYITGDCDQERYFTEIRRFFQIDIKDEEFENMILNSFKIRYSILEIVDRIRGRGVITAILSDQTDWLDRLDSKYRFFRFFDYVFNSYHIKMGKRDEQTFIYVADKVGLKTSEIIFIDDQSPNVERAKRSGMNAVCIADENEIINFLKRNFKEV